MILTEQEKQELEELKHQRWFKVLQKIEEEAEKELFKRLAKFDVDDEIDRASIKKWQMYQMARTDFFNNIESHLRSVFVPE